MIKPLYETEMGRAYCGDAREVLKEIDSSSVDLVLTSPPFALRRKKSYGNVSPEDYIFWFTPFAAEIARILKPRGSFVLDIAGSWIKGQPTRSLYHYRLLLALCRPAGPFHLAQEFYWFNPAKMPAPAEWVTVKRIRVKEAVNPIFWLSKGTNPKASNRRVLTPYKKSMEAMLKTGYNQGARPSGHVVSGKWKKRNKGAIPPNVIVAANTKSTGPYLKACKEHGLRPHPARFVEAVPEFFVKFLTTPGDTILDPFAGSNVVGEVAEGLNRRWISIETKEEYLVGSAFRFPGIGESVLRKWRKQAK